MQALTALRNIAGLYRFQLRLGGDLLPRLTYASLYWGRYLSSRYGDGADPFQAHAASLRYLGRSGWSSKTATITTNTGLTMTVDLMTAVLLMKELYGDRIYENCDLDDFRPRSGEFVFDIGSQQGVFALSAAQKVGPQGRVVAVEPEPRNRGLLTSNIARNGFKHVTIFDCAVSDAAGETSLFVNPENTGGHSLVQTGADWTRVSVKKTTLSALAQETGCTPSLIKIDVEGSALACLRGGLDLIARAKPRIVLELDALEDAAPIASLLQPLGYRTAVKGNNLFATAAPRHA